MRTGAAIREGVEAPQGASPIMPAWREVARAEQLAPVGDWSAWLILAGRGFGKTRAGAEWVIECARDFPGCRIGLVGTTRAAAEQVMVDGESGILACAVDGERPSWKRTLGRLEWPNGSSAQLFSAVEADQVRGHQFHFAWCDELAHWLKPDAVWTNLRLALRLGDRPRALVTTTPRPLPLLRRWVSDPRFAVTRGSTKDNAANLPAEFVEEVYARYAGTSIGRQELDGEIIEALDGALWTLDRIAAGRVADTPAKRRVVMGVDPPAGEGTCGIVVVALGEDGRGYVLADRSVTGVEPHGWARAVAAAAAEFEADAVVAEVNNGGAMVESTLKAVEATLPLKAVRASHGKVARAEPVAALYAAGRVSHAGVFASLETEMCALTAGGGYAGPGPSPDRCDALVWALTETMLGAKVAGQPSVRRL